MRSLSIGVVLRHTVLVVLGVLTIIPFIMLLSLSFKSLTQFNFHRWTLTFPLDFKNYVDAWQVVSPFLWNSTVISGVTVIGVMVLSCLTAYALARIAFPMKELVYYSIISLLMIPGILTLIPQFALIVKLGMVNNWLGLWGPYIAGGQVFCIFVLRSFFASLSEEMFEAARLDGASEWRVLIHIVLPLSKPIIMTLAVLNILGTWNDYVWPLMIIHNPAMDTITLGLMAFQQEFTTNWGPLFAGYVIASLPLILLFSVSSKQFIEGLTSGAVKM